jgi:hypothetical protein
MLCYNCHSGTLYQLPYANHHFDGKCAIGCTECKYDGWASGRLLEEIVSTQPSELPRHSNLCLWHDSSTKACTCGFNQYNRDASKEYCFEEKHWTGGNSLITINEEQITIYMDRKHPEIDFDDQIQEFLLLFLAWEKEE